MTCAQYCFLLNLWLYFSFTLCDTIQEKRVGILYEGWHGYAANVMKTISQLHGELLSVEKVFRSGGRYMMWDILDRYNLGSQALNFYYQETPKWGYYCIYKKRSNESEGKIPDCEGVSQTLERHAKMLWNAGVDFIVVDSTNLPFIDDISDVLQIRPMEIIFEEFSKLRARGVITPEVAAWCPIPKNSNVWQWYLNTLYNNPSYSEIVMKDHSTGKKVFFIVQSPIDNLKPDEKILQDIEWNGGRNDTVVVRMWALFDPSLYKQGVWGFFSPCTDSTTNYTTSIVGRNCTQLMTTNSSIGKHGTAMSASPSYQLNFGSIPFGAPGKLFGLTMKKLFANIIEKQPDYVFISSWNEFIAQPQPNPFLGKVNTGFAMGLPFDAMHNSQWVDTYGSEFSRDIEPTEEYGDYYYNLMASCIRAYRNGSRACQYLKEECCNIANSEKYSNVWSLLRSDGGDYLLTTSEYEKNVLVKKGSYTEICSPFNGPTAFCVKSDSSNGESGPFMLFSIPMENTIPLYRCLGLQGHFFSIDPHCEGAQTESLLGYVSTKKSGLTLRTLHRCWNGRTFYHSLDLPCFNAPYLVVGFVR